MPKFNEKERKKIFNDLLLKGEELFAQHGLMKVTINELTTAAKISKGSFYAFFESKEHLFMHINYQQQSALFQRIEMTLKGQSSLSKHDLTKTAIQLSINGFLNDPFLSTIDQETFQYLKRKLSEELFDRLNFDDTILIDMLETHQISFKQNRKLIIKGIQGILAAAITFKQDEDYNTLIDLLIEGFITQIIE